MIEVAARKQLAYSFSMASLSQYSADCHRKLGKSFEHVHESAYTHFVAGG